MRSRWLLVVQSLYHSTVPDFYYAASNAPSTARAVPHAFSAHVRDMLEQVAAAGFDDIRLAHWPVLQWPGPEGERPSVIAERAGTSKQAINHVLRDLERLGYLELRPDPDDSRARLVTTTARGQALVEAMFAAAAATERAFESVLTRRPEARAQSDTDRALAARRLRRITRGATPPTSESRSLDRRRTTCRARRAHDPPQGTLGRQTPSAGNGRWRCPDGRWRLSRSR